MVNTYQHYVCFLKSSSYRLAIKRKNIHKILTKFVENQIENEGDLHLVQQRALSKHFMKIGCNSKNPPIIGFQTNFTCIFLTFRLNSFLSIYSETPCSKLQFLNVLFLGHLVRILVNMNNYYLFQELQELRVKFVVKNEVIHCHIDTKQGF